MNSDEQSILHEYIERSDKAEAEVEKMRKTLAASSDRLDASERVCKHVAMAHGKNHEILACVTCFLLKKWQEKVKNTEGK